MHKPETMAALALPNADISRTMEAQGMVYPVRTDNRRANKRGAYRRDSAVHDTFPKRLPFRPRLYLQDIFLCGDIPDVGHLGRENHSAEISFKVA